MIGHIGAAHQVRKANRWLVMAPRQWRMGEHDNAQTYSLWDPTFEDFFAEARQPARDPDYGCGVRGARRECRRPVDAEVSLPGQVG
jgi:hypothetical protein